MLSYEKCKELKDAGFPQNKDDFSVWYVGATQEKKVLYQNHWVLSDKQHQDEDVKIICMEEVIAEIDGFSELAKDEDGKWIAWQGESFSLPQESEFEAVVELYLDPQTV